MFKIVLTASRTVTLSTTSSIDTYGTLYDASGNVIDEMDDTCDTNLNFTMQNTLAAGTYYLAVEGYDSSVRGAYTVKAQ
jgi:hypothetical protein